MTASEKKQLQILAAKVRMGIIESTHGAKAGHPGGSLSATEMFTYLYFKELNIDPKNPKEVTVALTLPVAAIDRWAFYDCDSITRLLILKEMKDIPDMAFYGCNGLFKIIVEQGNPNYSSADGNLYNKAETKLIQYAIGKISTSFTVPAGVTEIGYGAFACNTNLKNVTIGADVTAIRESAFAYCTEIETIVIPDKVTIIGEAAFACCYNLTSVTIGSGVKTIEKGAFNSCTKLTSVTFKNTAKWYVGTNADGSGKKSITLPSNAASYLTTTYMNYYWFWTK